MSDPDFDPTVLDHAETLAREAEEMIKNPGSAELARVKATIATAFATIEDARASGRAGDLLEEISDRLDEVVASAGVLRTNAKGSLADGGVVRVPVEHHKPYAGDVRPPAGPPDIHIVHGARAGQEGRADV